VTGSKEKTVIRLTPFLLIAALAGCTAPLYLPGAVQPPAEPAGPAPLPVEVAPFVPPGTPSSVIFTDAAGCYLYSVERTDPPSGFPVRDAAGRQVCQGQPTTLVAPSAPSAPAPQTSAPAPVPLVPTTPPPVTGGAATGGITTGGANLIDGTPITSIPAPAPLPVPLPTPVE
jgi:hypothetical protein